MPPEVYKQVGEGFGPESELEFTAHLATGDPPTGSRLAIADISGRFRCPACGAMGQLPPPEELSAD